MHIVQLPELEGAALAPLMAAVEATMQQLIDDGAAAGGTAAAGGRDVLGPIARSHLATGGKRLRARLSLTAGLGLGCRPQDAVVWAAACELAHNATLLHDDVQDGDRMRRGQPTCWVTHGVAQAINAGDLLLMLPVQALSQAPGLSDLRRAQLVQLLATSMVTVIRGQALECDLQPQRQVDPHTYERIIAQKTAALFELPVRGAAVLAGCDAATTAAIAAAFAPLGMLFQMQDDVLDLYGDKGREAPGADLYEGKLSALVVAHCQLHPKEQGPLVALLSQPRPSTSADQVAHFIRRFAEGGALQRVLGRIDQLAQQAEQALLSAAPVLSPVLIDLLARVLRPISHLGRHPCCESAEAAHANIWAAAP